MNNKYQPLEDRCLVRENKKVENEVTEGGLIVPDSVSRKIREGEIYAIGGGRYATESGAFMPTVLAKGDVVLFGENTGTPLTLETENGREDLLLFRESDILLLVKKNTEN